jgi:hypothetical protein
METQGLDKIIAEHPFFADLESDYTALLVSECALRGGRVHAA